MAINRVLIAYIPVIHQGYINFFRSMEEKVDIIFLFGSEIINKFDHLARKDLRAIDPSLAAIALREVGFSVPISLCTESVLVGIVNDGSVQVIMPDEHECHELADMFALTTVEYKKVFLRWHQGNILVQNEVALDRVATMEEFDRLMMAKASIQAERSLDWWRQVGAVLVRDEEIVLSTYNQHVPDERTPYVMGDPRACFKKGLSIELSTAVHAEAGLIAEAARRGICTEGCSLYVTTFPCPPCAKLVAYSGIKKVYFQDGYSILDGENILRHQGVEIVQVIG